MGVSAPKGLTIAGFRASIFKRVLKAFERTNSPSNFVALKSVVGDARNGAIIFEECLDHGQIAALEGRYELTEAGEAIAMADLAAFLEADEQGEHA